jgi:hypothetical protein
MVRVTLLAQSVTLKPWALLGAGVTVSCALVAALLALRFPGTPDVPGWVWWMDLAAQHGPIRGYGYQHFPYPPGSFELMWLFSLVWGRTYIAAKVCILGFWCATAVVTLLTARRLNAPLWLGVALAVNPAILLNGPFLGFLDILIAPFLLLALLTATKRPFISGILFGVAPLLKWQPIILLPFFLAFACVSEPTLRLRSAHFVRWLGGCALCVGVLCAGYVVDGGSIAVLIAALHDGLSYPMVSGNALNLNWVRFI